MHPIVKQKIEAGHCICGRGLSVDPRCPIHKNQATDAERKRHEPPAPKLTVWFGSMPESNGRTNWTAILHRGDLAHGFTIERSEHHDRVRYEADRVRHLIGELAEEPDILAYDAEMLSPPGVKGKCHQVNAPHTPMDSEPTK